jgi:hypothetical protein
MYNLGIVHINAMCQSHLLCYFLQLLGRVCTRVCRQHMYCYIILLYLGLHRQLIICQGVNNSDYKEQCQTDQSGALHNYHIVTSLPIPPETVDISSTIVTYFPDNDHVRYPPCVTSMIIIIDDEYIYVL